MYTYSIPAHTYTYSYSYTYTYTYADSCTFFLSAWGTRIMGFGLLREL